VIPITNDEEEININYNEKKINLRKPSISNQDRDNREKKAKRTQNIFGTELDYWDYFMKMIKSILKFVPLGLGFYDELSDFLYYNSAKFVDKELKNIFLFFLFLSPAI
jgi:hypothetical protein